MALRRVKNAWRKMSEILSTLSLMIMLGGCVVWVVEPRERDTQDFGPWSGYSYEIWFNDIDVYCQYDTEFQRSSWLMRAEPDTSYGQDEIEAVTEEILGSYAYSYVTLFDLVPDWDGRWRVEFDNQGPIGSAYHCGSTYEFEFVAYDYDGFYARSWVDW